MTPDEMKDIAQDEAIATLKQIADSLDAISDTILRKHKLYRHAYSWSQGLRSVSQIVDEIRIEIEAEDIRDEYGAI